MKYLLYKLKFVTPVHFGDVGSGGGLEKVAVGCGADTFFSALCNEIASLEGSTGVEKFIEAVKKDEMVFSDLYPYCDKDMETQLLVPKPILTILGAEKKVDSLENVKKEREKSKKYKKMKYIRVSEMDSYLKSSKEGKVFKSEVEKNWAIDQTVKVNMRGEEPLPYLVGSVRYLNSEMKANKDVDTGLYFVVGVKDDFSEESIDKFTSLLEMLGYSGIGGKRSSGYGKFEINDDPFEMQDPKDLEGYEPDKDYLALNKCLIDDKSLAQMALSTFLPSESEIDIVGKGEYKLIEKSGFINDLETNTVVKRNSIYMIEAGACFEKRVKGEIVKFNIANLSHPVYRYGKSLFMGLKL